MMFQRIAAVLLFCGLILSPAYPAAVDEGMYPISEIMKLDLRSKGLEIDPAEIYSTDRSLIFAIVGVGATGSFVSPDGLFVTNHHVAFGAVQAASTRENDYIRDGFLARTRAEEIQAKGMTARITESFRDVSAEVLSSVLPGMDFAARTKAIEKRTKEIVAQTEKDNPGKRAEVSEMFTGKTYILFIYTYLKDIRMVYVPPRSIGEFGGEEDNWMWPRHTGDFSFLRAYVAPDGSPADYSPQNVPFKPKRFLRIQPRGVDEGDFVFLLGYPGRTYRHSAASFLAFEEEVRMPYVVDWYARQIDLMEKMGAGDRGVALLHASRIKGLANTMKNYRGKLKGMKRLGLVERRREDEKALQRFIEADLERRERYGTILTDIAAVYDDNRASFGSEAILGYLGSSVNLLGLASTVHEAGIERPKPDLEREPAYMDRNFPRVRQRLMLGLRNHYEPTDKAVFRELILKASKLPEASRIKPLDEALGGDFSETAIGGYLNKMYAGTRLNDSRFVEKLLEMTPGELAKVEDPFLDLARALYPDVLELREKQKARRGALDPLYARLSDVKELFLGKGFIPDANGTLRLTYGRIKGYEPVDAVDYSPITTLRGVIEKTTGREPFDTPPALAELFEKRDFGAFEHPRLRDVPVCILYDTDTTGGNSGSPVINARGELIGINFDRTYEATINDYAWSEEYSRSIAVDIRYVLWVTQKFGRADFLLKELGL
ncbi:MAG: S46 family peptidase [Candidatus Aminicenantes bacterium]|nr:S46 family peptidase [Candidatus Aminicenantes bacterium]